MITVISSNLPRRVRGVLNIWLLEPKAGVFVGNLNKKIESRIFKFLTNYMNGKHDLIIIRDNALSPQGFEINTVSSKRMTRQSGLLLTQEIQLDL